MRKETSGSIPGPIPPGTTSGPKRLLLADDHQLVAETISHSLSQQGWTDIILAQDFDSAYDIAARSDVFDVILLDLNMPGMQGMASLRAMIALHKGPVAVITGAPYAELMDEVLHVGGGGVLTKGTKIGALPMILQEIASGGFFCSADLLHSPPKPFFGLSPSLIQVADLIVEGLTDPEIALQLGKPATTIKMQIRRIFLLLDVKNRTQAATVWHEARGGHRLGAQTSTGGTPAT